jgi:hypothetical protein
MATDFIVALKRGDAAASRIDGSSTPVFVLDYL